MISFALFDTAIGRCGVAWSDRGITRIQLPDANEAGTRTRLTRGLADAKEAAPPSVIREAMASITRHLCGDRVADLQTIPLDMQGTAPFFRLVYEASRAIPSGKTISYGELAAKLGKPGAARAIGQAMGKNPFPIVVPCHRVLAAHKAAGGFSAYGGVETKAKILAIEGFTLPTQPVLPFAGLSFDATRAILHLRQKDRRLGALIDRALAFRLDLKPTQTTFHALAESIVYQQLNGRAAGTIFGRLEAACTTLTPEHLLATRDAKLRKCGLSAAKLAALKDLAKKTLEGVVPTVEELHGLDDDTIVERLTEVRGIGRWTVEMLLIFRLGRPDVLPVDDYGVRKGFALTYRKKELPKPKELAAFGERWRPYRTVASWYLWRALDSPGGRALRGRDGA
jgi:methylated-DNA-[protein]-cysteine S-methyltransferase